MNTGLSSFLLARYRLTLKILSSGQTTPILDGFMSAQILNIFKKFPVARLGAFFSFIKIKMYINDYSINVIFANLEFFDYTRCS